MLGAAWLRSVSGLVGPAVMPARGRGLAAVAGRAVARPLRAIARRSGEVHAGLGRAVEAFVADWARLSPPIIGARARRLLHLCSAAIALGLIAGLYFRGIVFRYEAGWESTFLGPSQVLDVLRLVYGPAARLSGVALPASTEAVAELRWDGAGGGGDAAPWIHLIAVTLAIYVVIPRIVLAAAGWLAELRSLFSGIPPSLTGYARRAFGAAGRGMRSAVAVVTPYAYEPPAGTLAALQSMLARHLGTPVRLATQPPLHYGEEALAGRLETDAGAPPAEVHVLLFSLGATPESENHGLVVTAVRDAVQRARPAPELLIVVDEAPYVTRMGPDESYEATSRRASPALAALPRGVRAGADAAPGAGSRVTPGRRSRTTPHRPEISGHFLAMPKDRSWVRRPRPPPGSAGPDNASLTAALDRRM